ncbi:MAG: hypothetical protein AB7O04_10900 [Hyphomonadaceae bacterium]
MSRRSHPRRIYGLFGAAFLAGLCFAAPAAAQIGGRNDAAARTTIGGGANLRACGQAVQTGVLTDAAVAACNQAIDEDRLTRLDRRAALLNRGVLHLRRREGEAALADFDAAIALDADLAEAHLNRGAALVLLQQPGPAVAAITLALSLGVEEPYKAFYNRGAAREALGDLRGAYEDYSTALEIHPHWAPAEEELARFVRGRQEHLAQLIAEDAQSGAQ